MNALLRLILTIGTLLFFVLVTYMIRRKRLSLKYTLTWLGASFTLMCLTVFYDALVRPFARFLQVIEPMNAFFLFLIDFSLRSFFISLHILKTHIISKLLCILPVLILAAIK